jgi:hypothetical protein
MGNVITLSECSCGVQRVRRAISRKKSSWATSVINLVQRRNRTGLKILENHKNIQSIISVNTNILLRRFRLKFLRIMYSTSCYKERLNFENTLYYNNNLVIRTMPAVSEFTKSKILTLHQQRGMSYGQISTNLGLSQGTIHAIMRKLQHTGTRWFGVQVLEEVGFFCGTERGTPELSPKSVPVHEE